MCPSSARMGRLLGLVLIVPFVAVQAYFRDDFNSWNPGNYHTDVTAWGGGNGEFQVYTPESRNIYVRDGHLYLRPTFTDDFPAFHGKLYHGDMNLHNIWHTCTNGNNYGCHKTSNGGEILPPIMSGKITSHYAMKYGRVNVRAKIPKGDWIWPAIWMLPRDNHYGSWPRSGEIDMMESRGNSRAVMGGHNRGVNNVGSTLHWGPAYNHNAYYKTHHDKMKEGGGDWHDDFHVYSLDWTEHHIVTYVDNVEILRVNTPGNSFWGWGGFSGNNIWSSGGKNAPFDQPFHLLLNVAVGGGFFGDASYDTSKPWGHSSHPMRDFWEHRGQWQQTWHSDQVAMILDYVEMIPQS